MIKHDKVRTTKSKKKIENNKSISNNVFKTSLFLISFSAIFFSVLIIGFVIIKGFSGAGEVWDGGNWLFGGKYDGAVYFAAGFMLVNTVWTSLLAAAIAVPISVLTALFITRVAPKSLKPLFFVVLSILAAIPSVIYGAFGSRALDWIIMGIFGTSSGTLLTIVITLAFMIMPTITLITTTSINSIDKKMEMSSLALGATRNQTSFQITIRAASTGILMATILGMGRALGEATAVSMISVDPYTGPTFGLLGQIRLLTSTMLKGYNEMEPGSIQQASMFAMAMLLIITILVIFMSLRFIQKTQEDQYKSNKAAKKINNIRSLEKSAENDNLKNLSISDQRKFYKLENKHAFNNEIDSYYHKLYNKEMIFRNTTVKQNYEKQKENKSKMLGGLTWGVAFIGLIFLLSVILFLLILGLPGLNWTFISTQGEGGINSAIFGTVLLVGLSILMIIPLGVGTGIYLSTFAKENKITKAILISIDILAGIPSLIFGLIGAAIFLPLATSIGFAPLAGAIILTLIVIPTVIQTTQEAIKTVPKSEVYGSLALGSTKTISILKIALPQAMPQIIAGIILSVGRIIGESAAIVMVFGTVSRNNSSEWMQLGGTTLATEMYRLTLLEEIPWDQVAAIGLVILSLILILSLMSNYISHKNYKATLGIILSFILILTGIFIGFETGFVIFIFGTIIFISTIILNITLKWDKG